MSKTCWLYGRFSTGEQKEGDSRKRQERLAKEWEKKAKASLTRIFFDEGISGGHGREKRPQLDAMLTELETKTPPDSILVDDPDRLSRQKPMDALKLWEHILNFCEIVDLRAQETYSKATWQGTRLFLVLTLKVSLSAEERQKRIERGKNAWIGKREGLLRGEMLTRSLPAWLNKDRSPNKSRVRIVESIFQWYAEGLGMADIVVGLKRNNVPPMGKGKKGNPSDWHWSYISALLHSRSVLGEYQPHTVDTETKMRSPVGDAIPDYYPAIIDYDLWAQVQAKLAVFQGKAPKTKRVANLLSGLGYCRHCGAKVYLIHTGKKQNYLTCWNSIKHLGCDTPSIPYGWIEESLIDLFSQLLTESMQPLPAKSNQSESMEKELSAAKAQVRKYSALIEAAKNALAAKEYMGKHSHWLSQQSRLEKEVELDRGRRSSAREIDYESVIGRLRSIKTDVATRRQVHDLLMMLVSRIDVDRLTKSYKLTLQMGSDFTVTREGDREWRTELGKGWRNRL